VRASFIASDDNRPHPAKTSSSLLALCANRERLRSSAGASCIEDDANRPREATLSSSLLALCANREHGFWDFDAPFDTDRQDGRA